MNATRRAFTLGLALVSIGAPLLVHADDFPSRAIRIIVPYPAGAAGDIQARLVGDHISATLKQPVVIDNRPGGAGIAATDVVARSAPDGYTLLLTGPNYATNVGLHKSLPYDPLKDFDPVSLLSQDYVVIMVNPKSGITDVKDLIEKARADPKTINYSSSGIGTAGHLAMEMFQRAAGIELFHIPYRGATPAITDAVSGQVALTATGYAAAKSFIDGGQLKPLLISSEERSKALPSVPTGREMKLDWVVTPWFGLSAPAGTPVNVVNRLSKVAAEAMQSKPVADRMDATGTIRVGSDPVAFRKFVEREIDVWPKLIRDVGIAPQ